MYTSIKTNKIERKLKKLQHIVLRETGITCTFTPTKNVVILNVGLVSGLSEDVVFEHFSKYGIIERIILLPGKSCTVLSYEDIKSAWDAYKNYNGKLNIAQNDKPVYLLFTENVPEVTVNKSWGELPPGLLIIENFINEEEESNLLKVCDFDQNPNLDHMKHRQVKHYGYEFKYDTNNVEKDNPLSENIPSQFDFLWARLEKKMNVHFCPDQLTINYYSPGQGIPHHIDTHSAFENPIVSLSLQSSIVMEFKRDERHICALLPSRSLTIMSNESRYDWTHGITPRKFDILWSKNGYTCLKRGTRISFTFRKIRQGECNCIYKTKCNSYGRYINESKIEDTTASELEKLHVHKVYENIASHFSDTRHKPWPNVLKFVKSFDTGSVLVDVGCGNGKYLDQNQNIFNVGCDRSFGLIDVCRTRGFETFTGDCLSIPLKDNIADGVISIAVIHHLATEDRRLLAIKEIIRILKEDGLALIYVWAKDQHKDKQRSSYIKQDRKNRNDLEDTIINAENSEEMCILDGVSLPIHTNRTQFKHSNLLVPWKLKNENTTYLRFYHVFEETELESLCLKVEKVEIVKSYYDQGNWCVVIKKKINK